MAFLHSATPDNVCAFCQRLTQLCYYCVMTAGTSFGGLKKWKRKKKKTLALHLGFFSLKKSFEPSDAVSF